MKNIERKLHQLDATDLAVGRLATKIALILRGKNKPEYQAHLDLGDIVEVKNISKMKFTGSPSGASNGMGFCILTKAAAASRRPFTRPCGMATP